MRPQRTQRFNTSTSDRGIDRFGVLKDPEGLEPVTPEREQDRLEDISEANQRADRIIALLNR